MLGISLSGRLGNQMFEYAAARVQADRLGCPLYVEGECGLRKSITALRRGRPGNRLFDAFPGLSFHHASVLAPLLLRWGGGAYEALKRHVFPKEFWPGCHDGVPSYNAKESNVFDPKLWRIESGTMMRGYYQSDKYFSHRRRDILEWFTPSDNVQSAVEERLRQLPGPVDKMLAVHVRLGDYALQHNSASESGNGWVLGGDYYARALECFDARFPIALFSDEPERATHMCPRPPSWIANGGDEIVDMFTIARFKNVVIANSSYSWWAAWLNGVDGRNIVAPLYHIGRAEGVWFPADIAVGDWSYV